MAGDQTVTSGTRQPRAGCWAWSSARLGLISATPGQIRRTGRLATARCFHGMTRQPRGSPCYGWVASEAGLTSFRRATETPFNLVLEARA